MIVVMRFRVDQEGGDAEATAFRVELLRAAEVLAERPGHRFGQVGRNIDDPTLWTLVTAWESTGAYRRALSSYEVKLHAVPVLSRALDEPSAYEPADAGEVLNHEVARGAGPEDR